MRGGGVRARGVLPLRAMPQGELLDAAVVLFRARALPLLLIAAPLMAIEQVVLYYAGATWLDQFAGFADWWQVGAAQFACDAVTIGLVGAYAGAAAVPAMLGDKVTHRALVKRIRPLPVLVTVLLTAAPLWAGAYFGLAGGLALYGFFGLGAVALTIDRSGWPFGAYGRSASVAGRLGWRGFWTRLWAYAIWFGIRCALAVGPIVFVWNFGFAARFYFGDWPVLMMWGLAGAVSCAALACFDAVLLLDTRIRTEGLDLAVHRARAGGLDPMAVITHQRPSSAAAPRTRTFAQMQGLTQPQVVTRAPAPPPMAPGTVRPPTPPPGMSRQAQMQWQQAQAQLQWQAAQQAARQNQGRES